MITLLLLSLLSLTPAPADSLPGTDDSASGVETHLRQITDTDRDRQIPVRIYLPEAESPLPVILYSHGLGGSRDTNQYLGRHWASQGYVVVYIQHHGSDAALLELSGERRSRALRQAVSGKNLILRVQDVSRVIDELERWNAADELFQGRFDLEQIGASGHSFGAKTVQWLTGENTGRIDRRDPRIDAALILSPNMPLNREKETAFTKATIPWLLITGTADDSPLGVLTAEHRQQVFPALPPGCKYELVLSGAGHFAYTERGPAAPAESKDHFHQVIRTISTAFWDAWLKGDTQARDWLNGDGPSSILNKNDRWQKK